MVLQHNSTIQFTKHTSKNQIHKKQLRINHNLWLTSLLPHNLPTGLLAQAIKFLSVVINFSVSVVKILYFVHRDSTGTARLAEALQAHVWPHMTMKSGTIGTSLKDTASVQALTKQFLSEDEKLLAGEVGEEQDPGGNSFEELFAKFTDMKGMTTAHCRLLLL